MPNLWRVIFAAFPFLMLLMVLLAVYSHPGADRRTRLVGGMFAAPLLLIALRPRLSLGETATPGDRAAYLAIVGGGLVLIALRFGRNDLE